MSQRKHPVSDAPPRSHYVDKAGNLIPAHLASLLPLEDRVKLRKATPEENKKARKP